MALDMHDAQADVTTGKAADPNQGVQAWINYITAGQSAASTTESLQNTLWSAHQTSLHQAIHVDLNDYAREAYEDPAEGRFMSDVVKNVDRSAVDNMCSWKAPLCSGLIESATSYVYPQSYPATSLSVTQEETEAAIGNEVLGLAQIGNIGMYSRRWAGP